MSNFGDHLPLTELRLTFHRPSPCPASRLPLRSAPIRAAVVFHAAVATTATFVFFVPFGSANLSEPFIFGFHFLQCCLTCVLVLRYVAHLLSCVTAGLCPYKSPCAFGV